MDVLLQMRNVRTRLSLGEAMYQALLANKGFKIHAIVYVAVNLLLLTIDLTVDASSLWFFWPLLGWGIGLFGHGVAVWQKSNAQTSP